MIIIRRASKKIIKTSMNTKNLLNLTIILLVVQFSFGQKIKIKKGDVLIEKQLTCKIEKDDVSRGAFYINSLNDEQLLYLKWIDWGEFGYFETYRASDLDNILFETESTIGFRKWIIKKLYNAKVISTEGLDNSKLISFSKKIGKEFTRKRNKY